MAEKRNLTDKSRVIVINFTRFAVGMSCVVFKCVPKLCRVLKLSRTRNLGFARRVRLTRLCKRGFHLTMQTICLFSMGRV